MTPKTNNKAKQKQNPEKLRENETFLESLIDTIPIPIFYKDRRGCYIGCNKSFEDLYGVKREEITGKSAFDITSSKLAKIYRTIDNEIIDSGKHQRFESQIRDRHGELRDVIAHKAALKDDAGNITGVIGTLLDITDRNRVEESQQRLNRELRAMSSCRQAMIRATDEESLINDICRIICDEAGYRMAWVGYVEHNKEKTIQPVAWHGHNTGYMEQANLSWSGETERGRGPAGEAVRNGKSVYVEDFATDPRMAPWREAALQRGYRSSLGVPLKDENGRVLGLLSVYSFETGAFTEEAIRLIEGLANDMSFGIAVLRTRAERTQAEEALHESETRFRTLVDHATDAFFLHDSNGLILDVNQQACDSLGYAREELIGMTPLDLDPDVDEETLERLLARLDTTDEVIGFEAYHRRKDGTIFPVELRIRSLWHGGSRVAICLARNITERRRRDEERERLQAQLLQAQKMESIGRLAGGIAHDFNNMLGVIIGYTDLAMRHTEENQRLSSYLQQIRKAGESSADLTRQLLAFARKQTITPAVLNLNETVEGMLNMLRRMIGEDIHLVWLPGSEIYPIRVDPAQIDQVLANLCVNARDAFDEGGKVIIETRNVTIEKEDCAQYTDAVPGDYVLLVVGDNGSGMNSETLANAFEPFFTTKGTGKGTGLGLATVYGIVKQHNGFIDIKSAPGEGTFVEIYLPRYAGEAGQNEAPTTHQQGTEKGSETILLVEDEAAILDITRLMLEKCGYRVLTASTPDIGIRMAREHDGDIHLLVTDVVMPGMNGRELANEINAPFPEIRQLFMSGYPDDVITHQGVLDKGVHFIQKPFSMQNLAAKVREMLDGG